MDGRRGSCRSKRVSSCGTSWSPTRGPDLHHTTRLIERELGPPTYGATATSSD